MFSYLEDYLASSWYFPNLTLVFFFSSGGTATSFFLDNCLEYFSTSLTFYIPLVSISTSASSSLETSLPSKIVLTSFTSSSDPTAVIFLDERIVVFPEVALMSKLSESELVFDCRIECNLLCIDEGYF